MTRQRRLPSPDTAAMHFLIDDFVDVADGDEGYVTEAARKALARFQRETARVFSPQQRVLDVVLARMPPARFQALRRMVRGRLLVLATGGGLAHPVTLTLLVPAKSAAGSTPVVEGPPEDVLWFYVANLVSRAGASQIALCPAPPSKRDPQAGERCDRLFVRRGSAKRFCSARCRARVASQRRPGRRRAERKGKER